jgi:uncharacterized damage-inducible protein DinB
MSNVVSALQELLLRDLKKLENEIASYSKEEAIWITKGQINNSAGNLCLHLCGNLQHYIAHQLGRFDYQRDRPREFSAKCVPREELIIEIQRTYQAVDQTLSQLTGEQLNSTYPEDVLGKPMSTAFFLIHLSGHLNYHLGQINYHRRLTD